MIHFDKLGIPPEGKKIEVIEGRLSIPDNPIIPFIEGDGVGPEIMKVTRKVLDVAINKAYKGKKKIVWLEIYAGEKAKEKYGEFLPQDTLKAIKYFIVAIKGPLTTPIGGGYRSLNVTLRQTLDLYACIRPLQYIPSVPSPVVHPEKMNLVIFRENIEDVYAGIEWPEGSTEAKKLISYLKEEFKVKIREDSGIGIKPISQTGSKRLVRKAIQYAIDRNCQSVTLVHKGNIMKFTEGAEGKLPQGKLLIKDRVADSMFQQVLTRTDEYDVVALTNLNGDYLSDACAAQIGGACAAQIGGLGMAPGANIGDHIALFEATHGTAPKYAGQDKVNPSSLILSGVMMLEYLGWQEATDIIHQAIAKTINEKKVTYDLARLMKDVEPIKCSEFGEAVIENMEKESK